MDELIQSITTLVMFGIVVKIIWDAINTAILSVMATPILGVSFGELLPLLCGSMVAAAFFFVIVAIGIQMAYQIEDWLDFYARRAKRRLIETRHAVIQLDGTGWRVVETPAPRVIAPPVQSDDRIIPVSKYRNPNVNYRQQWRDVAGAFLAIASQHGLNRRSFQDAGVSQNEYSTIAKKLLELGILVLKNPRNANEGYRFLYRNNRPVEIPDLLNLDSWDGGDFSSPPPAAFVAALADLGNQPQPTNGKTKVL